MCVTFPIQSTCIHVHVCMQPHVHCKREPPCLAFHMYIQCTCELAIKIGSFDLGPGYTEEPSQIVMSKLVLNSFINGSFLPL